MQSVGFIGLGNVGGKLAGSLLRNKCQLMVRDLEITVAQPFIYAGATWAESPKIMAEQCDIVITCLPSPAASAAVMEADDGILAGLSDGKIWAEMSTTDAAEVTRLGALVKEHGADPVDCPVSGGCHRAATGNIAIFAGCDRPVFEKILPFLTILGCWRSTFSLKKVTDITEKVANIMILSPTSLIGHHHKIANITLSPISLLPI